MDGENQTGDFAALNARVKELHEQVKQAIFGQEELICEALCAFLSQGHILITGAPGLAKTTLVKVIAKKLGLHFGRIQFTPDLLPSDITGTEVLNIDPETQVRGFEFMQGPIFANLLLADEVNRASPRTQSATLEAMQERRITVAGKEYPLPEPFMVFATQNPFESEGTFVLPEAQLDRFLLHSLVDYPPSSAEQTMLQAHADNKLNVADSESAEGSFQALAPDEIKKIMDQVQKVNIHENTIAVINELVRSTRPSDENCPQEFHDRLWFGAGPRAGLSLISVSRAYAFLQGDEVVRWQHVVRMAKPVLRHRIQFSLQISQKELGVDEFIDIILENIKKRCEQLIS